MVMNSMGPVAVPSNAVNSRETTVAVPDVLARAMPLLTEWGWPDIPLAFT